MPFYPENMDPETAEEFKSISQAQKKNPKVAKSRGSVLDYFMNSHVKFTGYDMNGDVYRYEQYADTVLGKSMRRFDTMKSVLGAGVRTMGLRSKMNRYEDMMAAWDREGVKTHKSQVNYFRDRVDVLKAEARKGMYVQPEDMSAAERQVYDAFLMKNTVEIKRGKHKGEVHLDLAHADFNKLHADAKPALNFAQKIGRSLKDIGLGFKAMYTQYRIVKDRRKYYDELAKSWDDVYARSVKESTAGNRTQEASSSGVQTAVKGVAVGGYMASVISRLQDAYTNGQINKDYLAYIDTLTSKEIEKNQNPVKEDGPDRILESIRNAQKNEAELNHMLKKDVYGSGKDDVGNLVESVKDDENDDVPLRTQGHAQIIPHPSSKGYEMGTGAAINVETPESPAMDNSFDGDVDFLLDDDYSEGYSKGDDSEEALPI